MTIKPKRRFRGRWTPPRINRRVPVDFEAIHGRVVFGHIHPLASAALGVMDTMFSKTMDHRLDAARLQAIRGRLNPYAEFELNDALTKKPKGD